MRSFKLKKATVNWVPATLPWLLFFGVIVALCVVFSLVIAGKLTGKEAEIPEGVEAYILLERFFKSPDCFGYVEEEINKVYPVVDWNKFTNEQMKNCYKTADTSLIAFKFILSLYDERRSIQTPNWKEGYLIKNRFPKDVKIKGEISKTRMIVEVQGV